MSCEPTKQTSKRYKIFPKIQPITPPATVPQWCTVCHEVRARASAATPRAPATLRKCARGCCPCSSGTAVALQYSFTPSQAQSFNRTQAYIFCLHALSAAVPKWCRIARYYLAPPNPTPEHYRPKDTMCRPCSLLPPSFFSPRTLRAGIKSRPHPFEQLVSLSLGYQSKSNVLQSDKCAYYRRR